MTVKEIMEQAKDGSISWEDIKKREGLDTEMEKLEKMVRKLEEDTISRQATITEFKNYERDSTAPIDYAKIVEQMPPAQQEPKSPLYYGDGYSEGKMVYDSAECPNCGYIYDEGDQVWGEPYCPHCGQALDWYMRGEQDGKTN